MKKSNLIGLMLVAGMALVGCSNETVDKTDDTEKVQIKLWVGEDAYSEAIVPAIEEALPHIDIVHEHLEIGESADKLALDGPAGIGGDVVFHTQESMAKAFQSNVLLPLGDDLSGYVKDNMIEPSLRAVTSEETLYGVPMSVEALGLFYNKTLLEENGFEIASTFEELIEDANSYNDPNNGKYLMRFEPGNTYTAYMFLTAAGFELFGPDGTDKDSVNLNTPEVVQGLTYLKQLQEILEVPAIDLNYDTVHGEFVKGTVGYMLGGPWQIEEAEKASKELGFEWGVMPLPTIDGKQPKPFLGNIVATVSAYTEHPEEAREVLEFVTSEEGLQIMYDTQGKLPALKDLTQIDGVTEDPYLMGISEQCNMAISMPMLKELNYVYEAADVMVQSVWDGLATPEEAAEKAFNDYTQALKLTE